ncbi:MAG: hypothetical protein ABIH77_05380, partial [Pseudomonadota bacterium]|nr:hypothetical protein [Gammaproteobacteria bacterium]MBU2545530.1 hypothetical protein [Gammaproteobacteria bacterium]
LLTQGNPFKTKGFEGVTLGYLVLSLWNKSCLISRLSVPVNELPNTYRDDRMNAAMTERRAEDDTGLLH